LEMSPDSVDDLKKEMKRMEERSRGRAVPSFRLIGDRDRNELNYLNEKLRRFMYIADKTPHEPINVYCHHFPLLLLPSKLISRVFSFLSVEDRLKARVNKKLNAIELESKYYVRSLAIGDNSSSFSEDVKGMRMFGNLCLPYDMYRNDQMIMLKTDRCYSFEFLRKISRNSTIGQVSIMLNSPLNMEAYYHLCNLEADKMTIGLESYELASSIITGMFLLGLINSCKQLDVLNLGRVVTHGDLLILYNLIKMGKPKLKCVGMGVTISVWRPFLSLVGITIREGRIFSTNRDIQAFGCNEVNEDRVMYYFDNNMEISITATKSAGHRLGMRLHETQDSLRAAKAKANLVRIDLSME
ncbi:hypothetical protein PMAYCL1PPCAC_27977, partial [Pristionchus mayeri]